MNLTYCVVRSFQGFEFSGFSRMKTKHAINLIVQYTMGIMSVKIKLMKINGNDC